MYNKFIFLLLKQLRKIYNAGDKVSETNFSITAYSGKKIDYTYIRDFFFRFAVHNLFFCITNYIL